MQISDEMVKVAHKVIEQDFFIGNATSEEAVRHALTAALALSGWRTIDSAPINRAVLIKTNTPDYYGNSGIYEAILVDMGSGRRWHTFGYAVGRDLGGGWMPTHWKPLDAPPVTQDGRNEL